MAIPEFILRKLYVPGSLKSTAEGFTFCLLNTFAPATVTGMGLRVGSQEVAPSDLEVRIEAQEPVFASALSAEKPAPLPVGKLVTVMVRGRAYGGERLRLSVDTREAGLLSFGLQPEEGRAAAPPHRVWRLPRWLQRPLKAQVEVDGAAVIGRIDRRVYGHFVEHLERCVYGGVWSEDGTTLRQDTLQLIQALKVPVVRYPGGNFASGYHWEDGIGPRERRPRRLDMAWNRWDSNAVGTDEFLDFCRKADTEPFLVVNDGSGTPEEAARWVSYCNDGPETSLGALRALNGHADAYGVSLWGVGNEVWGQWQIGHTGAKDYAARLIQFVERMRQADPGIRIVAVGDGPLTDEPNDPARLWNDEVLRQAGGLIDYLSFHIYQPNQEGWQETYDLQQLHHTVCAAPLDVERIVQRMAGHIGAVAPGRDIKVALDEWNLWLSPPPGAETMHRLIYTQRDALYIAGMLNVFHRCCRELSLANLAQLVNVLPLIVTDEQRAVPTALYFPFWMYREMEPVALRVNASGPVFASQALGNINAHQDVPYLDLTATRDEGNARWVLGAVNRHPDRPMDVVMRLRGVPQGAGMRIWQMATSDPLAANTLEAPNTLSVREVPPQQAHLRDGELRCRLPAASVTVIALSGS
ncbi:MAG TPA: alpha-L-arabinofuranosidase C-terminal domain-containing protein [Anaerolineae bacterium]|nr:alpha-L-arabinofuranosidase C-terminal domain-containing protein [Anaerolineae bacterium]HQJ50587.1 alpha-L-arabinofuranosidase C-terminal domain-containing protein [Anaerolineae bacterium]